MNLSDAKHFFQCYLKKNQLPIPSNCKKKVIVSLTTTPIRISKIWPTLNSILLQSSPPEQIILWIPKEFKRFPNDKITRIPSFIEDNPFICVEVIENDFGPATKLLPCLKHKVFYDHKIIVIDDDRIYSRHMIRDLLRYEQTYPDSAIGIAGTVVSGAQLQKYDTTRKIINVDVLLGYNAYMVKPKFFSNTVFDYPCHLPEAFFEDDVWLSCNLQKMGIGRKLIPSSTSIQNWMTPNKRTFGLCMHENKDHRNFLKVFDYFKK